MSRLKETGRSAARDAAPAMQYQSQRFAIRDSTITPPIVLSQYNPNGAATVREPGLVQREFLDSPVGQLAHKKLVGIAAIHAVDRAKFLDQLAGSAESTHDLAIELHLINLA